MRTVDIYIALQYYNTKKWESFMLLPDFIFKQLTDISAQFLKDLEIELLLLDFDNTMLPYTTDTPGEDLLRWIGEMKAHGIDLCIVSNSKKQRVPKFSQMYDVPCVTHAHKPGIKGIARAKKKMGDKKAAFVGDQIFTDVLGANRAGIPSVLVKPIHNHNIWLKLRHMLELPFIAMSKKRRIT